MRERAEFILMDNTITQSAYAYFSHVQPRFVENSYSKIAFEHFFNGYLRTPNLVSALPFSSSSDPEIDEAFVKMYLESARTNQGLNLEELTYQQEKTSNVLKMFKDSIQSKTTQWIEWIFFSIINRRSH